MSRRTSVGPVSRRSLLGLAATVAVVAGASQWWQRSHAERLGSRVAALAAPGDLQMISSVTCGICTQARRWFDAHGVAYVECFVERDAACAERFAALRAPGTPVILVRGQPTLGFDPQRLLTRLERG